MKKLLFAACFIMLALATAANALDIPMGFNKGDERVTRAVYKDNEVYRINAYPGIGVHIIFAADEEVIDFGSGFSKAWEFKVGRGKNTFYLKPKMEGSDTNLFIQTNKHAYSFELVLFRDWKKSQKDRRKFPYDPQMVFRIEFTYPEDEAARTAKYLEDKKRQSRLDAIPAPYVRNSKYTMQVGENSREIVPTLAFDDGRFTYLKFPNNREIPAIFYVSADSSESLQNVHVENDLVVVQRVAREMVLRLGSQVVGLYNEAYDPDGVGPKNGVTIDGIKRTVKGDSNESKR